MKCLKLDTWKRKSKLTLQVLIVSAFSTAAYSETFKVLQKDKAFDKETLQVKVGDTVHFENADPFFHNVFSLSDAKFFDLGSFPKGESRPVIFDKAGTVEVECAIHPNMRMVIEVK